MPEYIEREAALEHAITLETRNAYELLVVTVDRIKDIPAADVEAVRHGKAVQLDHDEWWGAVYVCCECKGQFMLGDEKQAKRCPYCGAKMDGKGAENG